MTDAEHIDALRRIALRQPRISVTRAMRLIREQEAIRATTQKLRAESERERDTARLRDMAGSMEWLS